MQVNRSNDDRSGDYVDDGVKTSDSVTGELSGELTGAKERPAPKPKPANPDFGGAKPEDRAN